METLWMHYKALLAFLCLISNFASVSTACQPARLNTVLDFCSANFSSKLDLEVEIPAPPETSFETSSPSIYHVVSIPGKGLGVVAARKLPRGTKIIIEKPLLSIPMPEMVPGQGFRMADMLISVDRNFQTLSPPQQREFLELHDHRFPTEENQSKLLTILRSNAYNTGDDSVGVFPKIARINHSCKPNSGNFWSERKDHRVIYAFRSIEEGEEITVSYIPLIKSTKDRQARLHQYGFVCDCSACQSLESSKRRVKISDLIDGLEQKAHHQTLKEKTTDRMLDKAISLVELVEKEGLSDYMAKAYHFAAIFSERKGNLEKAKEWAIKELDMYQLAEDASKEALKASEYIDNLKAAEISRQVTDTCVSLSHSAAS